MSNESTSTNTSSSSSSFSKFVQDRKLIIDKATCMFDKLPDEVIAKLFNFLDVSEWWKYRVNILQSSITTSLACLSRVEIVCKTWSTLVWECQLHVDLRPFKTTTKMRVIEKLSAKNVQSLHLASTSVIRDQVSDSDLRRLGKSLERFLNLSFLSFDLWKASDLTFLKSLPHGKLETLSLKWCYKLDDASLAPLAALASLTSLSLSGCDNITSAGVGHLQQLTNLKRLDLSRCNKITDAGLIHLSKLVSLRRLWLVDLYRITQIGIGSLIHLTELEALSIAECYKLTNNTISESIAKMTSLTALDLSECSEIMDAGFEHLAYLTNLSYLNISGCPKITETCFAHTLTCLSLKCVDISKDLALIQHVRRNEKTYKSIKVIKNY